MSKVIAVENNLRSFKEFFTAQGCQVIDVEAAKKRSVDAVVLSGSDDNLMGMQDIIIDAPVISVEGKTPREVWERIMSK